MTQIRMKIILLFLSLILPSLVNAGPSLDELLTHDLLTKPLLVKFIKTRAGNAKIIRIRLHFLRGPDCYSGYIDYYHTPLLEEVFNVNQEVVFGISAEEAYLAARQFMPDNRMTEIHSVLMRLIDDKNQFIRFTGTCQDEGINCCIPIECSPASGVCIPKYEIPLQTIELASEGSDTAGDTLSL